MSELMSSKTKEIKKDVLRVTLEEKQLITALRKHDMTEFKNELSHISSRLKGEAPIVGSILSDLDSDSYLSVQDLVLNGVLSESDLKTLLSAFYSNKNIAIVGRAGSGKSILLQALVNAIHSDLHSMEVFPGEHYLPELKGLLASPAVSMPDADCVQKRSLLELMLSTSSDRMIMPESRLPEDYLKLASAIAHKLPVIYTSHLGGTLSENLEGVYDTLRTSIVESLKDSDFLTVVCYREPYRGYGITIHEGEVAGWEN